MVFRGAAIEETVSFPRVPSNSFGLYVRWVNSGRGRVWDCVEGVGEGGAWEESREGEEEEEEVVVVVEAMVVAGEEEGESCFKFLRFK